MSDTVRADELSVTLRRDARLSGTDAARAASLSQPKISRLETGKQVPTEAEVQALCRVYGAPAATRQQLLAVVRDMREEQVSARVMPQRGAPTGCRSASAASKRRRGCSAPSTQQWYRAGADPGYVRGLIGESLPDDELERIVAARGERQRLLDTDREFVLIMTEGAPALARKV